MCAYISPVLNHLRFRQFRAFVVFVADSSTSNRGFDFDVMWYLFSSWNLFSGSVEYLWTGWLIFSCDKSDFTRGCRSVGPLAHGLYNLCRVNGLVNGVFGWYHYNEQQVKTAMVTAIGRKKESGKDDAVNGNAKHCWNAATMNNSTKATSMSIERCW